MRLIDADALHFKCNSSRHIQAIYGPGFYAAEFAIDEAPTIDPNDLSVVQELRANIAILEQIIRNGSNPIDKDKIVSLMIENAALKSQIVNITAEKNAAINDLLQVGRGYDFCTVCAHCCEGGKPKYRPQEPYMEFCKKCNDDYSQFEWRDLKGANNADQKLYDEN